MNSLSVRLLAVALSIWMPLAARAQSAPPTPPPAPQQQASTDQSQLLSAGQLDALVAPIALYPDALLSEILMASTYPLEVVEADRWANANKNLQGDALKAALDKQNWDDSIKSLAATPDVLDMMSNKLDWTQQLGDAVLAQQPDVMDAIQRLRTKAQANNKLQSTSQQTVSTQQQGGRQYIYIAPTDPDEIYVPYYDPSVVYGPWDYPDYPAYYWPPPAYTRWNTISNNSRSTIRMRNRSGTRCRPPICSASTRCSRARTFCALRSMPKRSMRKPLPRAAWPQGYGYALSATTSSAPPRILTSTPKRPR